jgi:hypothetical protein
MGRRILAFPQHWADGVSFALYYQKQTGEVIKEVFLFHSLLVIDEQR